MPAKRKAELVRIIKQTRGRIFEKHSIRNAEISDIVKIGPPYQTESICVKFDGKIPKGVLRNSSTIDTPVIINFALDEMKSGTKEPHSPCRNPRINYHPLPELERMAKP